MQLRIEELDRHLAQRLAPVYLIGGEEPLFVVEGLDALRAAARGGGFTEREILEVESGFDWNELAAVAGAMSLFGDRRLVELRMPAGKPGTAGAKAIAAYCEQPGQDVVLVISCGALDYRQRTASWVKAVEQAGVFCYAWPLSRAQLPGWLRERLQRAGFQAEPAALELLVARAEGNLLAAQQEIEKLRLLHPPGQLTLEQVRSAVADSARFDVFGLADAALSGAVARCARIVRGLRAEGEEPTLVLWALARELRVLAAVAGDLSARRNPEASLRRHRVLTSRKALVQQAARVRPQAAWLGLLSRCARADRVIKGVAPGRSWDELLQLATAIAAQTARQAP
jgi:DNA polymerase III subunit delta